MNLNIRIIDPARPDGNLIGMAGQILNDGGIIVAPTETRYGLLGRIDDINIIKKIYEIKKRDLNIATAIFVQSRQEISSLAFENDISQKLADDFLPGALTLVLKSRKWLPPPLMVGGKIGLRFSSSNVIAGLTEWTNCNLTATSANLSGEPEADTVNRIAAFFGGEVDLYLDGGRANCLPSTVIECTGDGHRILREGAVPKEKILKSIAEI